MNRCRALPALSSVCRPCLVTAVMVTRTILDLRASPAKFSSVWSHAEEELPGDLHALMILLVSLMASLAFFDAEPKERLVGRASPNWEYTFSILYSVSSPNRTFLVSLLPWSWPRHLPRFGRSQSLAKCPSFPQL